nr:MAG TPA: hypothetical protein [Caudoviricetes sp.]
MWWFGGFPGWFRPIGEAYQTTPSWVGFGLVA